MYLMRSFLSWILSNLCFFFYTDRSLLSHFCHVFHSGSGYWLLDRLITYMFLLFDLRHAAFVADYNSYCCGWLAGYFLTPFICVKELRHKHFADVAAYSSVTEVLVWWLRADCLKWKPSISASLMSQNSNLPHVTSHRPLYQSNLLWPLRSCGGFSTITWQLLKFVCLTSFLVVDFLPSN